MTTSTITIAKQVEIAQNMTARAASRKDYLTRSKRENQMREIAREWSAGKGYKICSLAELKAEYGDLVHYTLMGDESDDKKQVWGICDNLMDSKHRASRRQLFTAI